MLAFGLAPVFIGLLAAATLPALNRISCADAWWLSVVAFAAAVIALVLRYYARLSLYRQSRFIKFSFKLLDAPHRRLYIVSACFIFVAIFLLVILLVSGK
jgi:hypothetical protein